MDMRVPALMMFLKTLILQYFGVTLAASSGDAQGKDVSFLVDL
jgi:hypothetical protein